MKYMIGVCNPRHLQPVAFLLPRPLLRRAFPRFPAREEGELNRTSGASRLVVRRRCQEGEKQQQEGEGEEQQQEGEGEEQSSSGGGGGVGWEHKRTFLSLEEAGLVEMSGLSTHERFLCRLTISSLNLLRVISEQEGVPIEELNAGHVCDWFLKDKLKREQNTGSAVLQWDDPGF